METEILMKEWHSLLFLSYWTTEIQRGCLKLKPFNPDYLASGSRIPPEIPPTYIKLLLPFSKRCHMSWNVSWTLLDLFQISMEMGLRWLKYLSLCYIESTNQVDCFHRSSSAPPGGVKGEICSLTKRCLLKLLFYLVQLEAASSHRQHNKLSQTY